VILNQYLASLRVVNGLRPPSRTHSVAEPWRVGDTYRWYLGKQHHLLLAGTVDEVFMPKTTENNLIVLSGKSEVAITN